MNIYKQLMKHFEDLKDPERLCVEDYDLDGMPLNKGRTYKIRYDFGGMFLVMSPFETRRIPVDILKRVFV